MSTLKDPEFEAMRKLVTILDALDYPTRVRVFKYLSDRLGIYTPVATPEPWGSEGVQA